MAKKTTKKAPLKKAKKEKVEVKKATKKAPTQIDEQLSRETRPFVEEEEEKESDGEHVSPDALEGILDDVDTYSPDMDAEEKDWE